MQNEIVIKVENISKKFCKNLKQSLKYAVFDIASEFSFGENNQSLRKGEFWALDDISFELKKGTALGIVGPNGAGKSTLLKLLNGMLKPDTGTMKINGSINALFELGTGFSQVLTGRENIYINAAVFGFSKEYVDNVIDKIIDFSEIEEFIDSPIKNYSSGMKVRLGYAIAAQLNPDILLLDEVFAVGDTSFRRKCIKHMQSYLKNSGTILLVSHNIYLLQNVCSEAILIDNGKIVHQGSSVEVVNRYLESQKSNDKNDVSKSLSNTELNKKNPVRIDKIEIVPLNKKNIKTGHPAKISISYTSLIEIENIYWGFNISTADQTQALTSGIRENSESPIKLTKGKGELNCTIKDFSLMAGTYTLTGIIGELETGTKLTETLSIYFTVESNASKRNNLIIQRGAFFESEICWED